MALINFTVSLPPNDRVIFHCPFCPYTTFRRLELAQHQDTHQLLECDRCGYKTNDRSNHYLHVLSHDNEYFCSKCGARFKIFGEWTKHLSIHRTGLSNMTVPDYSEHPDYDFWNDSLAFIEDQQTLPSLD